MPKKYFLVPQSEITETLEHLGNCGMFSLAKRAQFRAVSNVFTKAKLDKVTEEQVSVIPLGEIAKRFLDGVLTQEMFLKELKKCKK